MGHLYSATDSTIRIYDDSDWSTVHTSTVDANIQEFSVSPDETMIAISGSSYLRIRSLSDWSLIASPSFTFGGAVRSGSLSWSPDGKYLTRGALSADEALVIFETDTWERVATFNSTEVGNQTPFVCTFSPESDYLYATTTHNSNPFKIMVFSVPGFSVSYTLNPGNLTLPPMISPDGSRIILQMGTWAYATYSAPNLTPLDTFTLTPSRGGSVAAWVDDSTFSVYEGLSNRVRTINVDTHAVVSDVNVSGRGFSSNTKVTLKNQNGLFTMPRSSAPRLEVVDAAMVNVFTGAQISTDTIAATQWAGYGGGSATYDATPSDESVAPGYPVTFSIATTGVTDETELFWTLTGDLVDGDTVEGLSGSFEINADAGEVVITLTRQSSPGDEFALEIRTDSVSGAVVATSDTVTVVDPNWQIENDSTTNVVSEGDQVTFTITADYIPDDTRLWWRLKNTGGTETVIVENAPEVEHATGTATGGGASTLTDGGATWVVGEWIGASVSITGGTGDGQTRVITGNNATTLSVDIAWDTEPDNTSTYRIFTPADESEYSSDESIAGHDILESETSFLSPGPIIMSAGTGTVTLTLRQDFMTEGPEYIVLDIYDLPGPPFGDGDPVVASDPVIVLDTSNHEGVSFAVTALVDGMPSNSVEEGQTITFQVLVSEQPPAPHLLYYQITGTATGADFAGPISGTIEIDETGAGSFSTAIVADTTTEGEETFVFLLKVGYSGGPTVASTPVITILDTSRSPPTYAISSPSSVNEGSTLAATVLTTEVEDGTALYWTAQGDASADDFTDGQLQGAVTIIGNSGTILRQIKADLVTEGQGIADSGTASSGTIATLTDTSKAWEANEHAARLVRIISGTGIGQTRQIISNTDDTLTVSADWETAPDATSQYQIYQEAFRLHLRLGSVGGQIVAQTGAITIMDTSVNPPEYFLGQSSSTVAEGSSVSFTLATAFVLDETLYWTISGTATGADFAEGGSGTVSGGGGSITLTALRDYLQEGPETFVLQIRTGSAGGPIVIQSSLVTVLDATYAISPNTTQIVEGDTVTFSVQTQHHPSATFFWTAIGSVDTGDFVGGAMSGVVVVSGGVATIPRTLIDDGAGEGPEFFYIELRRDDVDGPIIAISPAVLVRENVPVDFDDWLALSIDTNRAILIELEHSDGWDYFSNFPYISHPGDTDPHRPYDDALYEAADIEARIDGDFTLGELSIVNVGDYSSLIAKKWRGYQVRILMGEPDWPLDDFRIVILATNGGLSGVEPGYVRWGIYDSKAIFNKPLQNNLLPNEQPIPIALGVPFNVTPALVDDPTHEYQINDGAVVSAVVRDNGAVVSATLDTGTGTFTLSARPQGNIGADPVAAVTTPAQIIAWVCSRFGVTLDSDTTADLPEYPMGLWYSSPTTGAQVLTDVVTSIGGYWLVNPLGVVEVYIIDEPDVTPDFIITEGDIVDRGLRMVGTEEPVKTLTLNYKRNWSPVSRDSLAGILDTFPVLAEELTQEWRSVTATNNTDDYPLAPDLTINTYLDDPADAQYECNRIAALRSVRRERWEIECFLSVANAQVGKTVGIVYPGMGWEEGRTARIIAVRRDLTRNSVTLEVWL